MKMKSLLSVSCLLSGLVAFGALADPTCTKEPKEKWMPFADAQKSVEAQGFQVKKFKTTRTGCYELYGFNTQGKKVEIYYNPVDMSIVKEEEDD